jgi:hypothetical protein
MVRSVVPEGRLEEAEGPLVGYRLEATMTGSKGEQLRMAGITRGAFPEEKLRLTIERLSPGLVFAGAGSVSGHPAHWAVYQAERPAAALTWFHPRNKLQYVVQLAGIPGQSGEDLRTMLLEGASSEDFAGIVVEEPPAKTEEM